MADFTVKIDVVNSFAIVFLTLTKKVEADESPVEPEAEPDLAEQKDQGDSGGKHQGVRKVIEWLRFDYKIFLKNRF